MEDADVAAENPDRVGELQMMVPDGFAPNG